MTTEQFIRAQVAAFCHREAHHHGGLNNMIAVALVLRNRKEAHWEGGDWMRLLESAPRVSGNYYPAGTIDVRDISTRQLLQQIDEIINGAFPDVMTEGALYYCELAKMDNPWFRENILKRAAEHPRVATVGPVSFFK